MLYSSYSFWASPSYGEQSFLVGTKDVGRILEHYFVVFFTTAGSRLHLTIDFAYLDWSIVMLKSLSWTILGARYQWVLPWNSMLNLDPNSNSNFLHVFSLVPKYKNSSTYRMIQIWEPSFSLLLKRTRQVGHSANPKLLSQSLQSWYQYCTERVMPFMAFFNSRGLPH